MDNEVSSQRLWVAIMLITTVGLIIYFSSQMA